MENLKNDTELKSKRKMLIWVALILLTICMTGATITEANTFLFKISFKKAENLSFMLFVATILLTVRYHNYAAKHLSALYDQWTTQMLETSYFLNHNPEGDEPSGLLSKLIDFTPHLQHGACGQYSFEYVRHVFNRKIIYVYSAMEHPDEMCTHHDIRKSLGFWIFLKTFWYELKFQKKIIVSQPEWIDLLGAYIISAVSIGYYLFTLAPSII